MRMYLHLTVPEKIDPASVTRGECLYHYFRIHTLPSTPDFVSRVAADLAVLGGPLNAPFYKAAAASRGQMRMYLHLTVPEKVDPASITQGECP